MSCWDSEHSRVRDEAFDDASPEVVSLIPDHVAGMRLAVMLAARGVSPEELEGLLAEAERVGRMADAFHTLSKTD